MLNHNQRHYAVECQFFDERHVPSNTQLCEHTQQSRYAQCSFYCILVVVVQSAALCTVKLVVIAMYALLVVLLGYMAMISNEMRSIPDCVASLQLPPHPGCNREQALCSKRYDETAHATMHNAFATTQDGIFFAQHRGCMRSALVHGVRSFMLDVHMTSSGNVALCHYSCTLGTVSLSATLDMLVLFVLQNPREIITIIWEMVPDTTGPEAALTLHTQWMAAMLKSGMPNHMFARQQNTGAWPTLQQMIRDGTRIVSFSSLRTYSWTGGDWNMQGRFFLAQTPFSSANALKLEQNCFVQTKFRPAWSMPWAPLLVMNQFTVLAALGINADQTSKLGHFFGIRALYKINGADLLWHRVFPCAQCLAQMPNFVVVDFWDSSGVVQVVHRLNNLSRENMQRIESGNSTACSVQIST